MMSKPTTILTGFLGAGKTTFLNHLLEQNKDTRYAIIENEFGEQSIDGELVVRPDETIVQMNNGCLCCTLNDNLYDILNELFERREEFDEVIIEATGVADPTGLAQPFIAHPLIKEHFPLRGIICLVDAEQIDVQIKETEEAKGQVGFSDLLIINKTDLVNEEEVQALAERLKILNPLATVIFGHKGAYPTIHLSQDDSPLHEAFVRDHGMIKTPEGEHNFPVHKPHHHHHHHHTEEMISHAFEFDKPFDPQLLEQQLFVYLMFQSKGLYRMKGLVWIEGTEDQVLIQSVGKRLDVDIKRKWQPGETRKSLIVFIGKNIKRVGLEKLLNRCISKHNLIKPQ